MGSEHQKVWQPSVASKRSVLALWCQAGLPADTSLCEGVEELGSTGCVGLYACSLDKALPALHLQLISIF
eukprot:scaffold137202_cov28-Tisochrysis_lutea.AAC.2